MMVMSKKPIDGLPRARGDGPCPLVSVRAQFRAAPRARGWTPAGEPTWPKRDIHPAPAGRRRTASIRVPLRSGPRSGTTPEISGLDREHAGVGGYGASRVGRSAHVGQESQGRLVRVAALR